MPSFESKTNKVASAETLTSKDISDDDSYVEGKKNKRARADDALATMFDFAIPDQTLDAQQHKIFGEAIAKGDKSARNEYISHRMRSIMIAALYRYNSQEPVINLDLEDHFQHILERFIEKVDEYKDNYQEFPNFSEYANRHLYWIGMNDRAETQSLPMTELSNKYRNRKVKPLSLFSEGLQPYHEIDPQIQGSSTKEVLDQAVDSVVEIELEKGMQKERSQRNANVLKMRTGILNDMPHTRAEIADEFGITPARALQIEKSAIKALACTVEIQNLKGIFEELPEGEYLNQNTPPSLYTVKKAIETLPLVDRSTPGKRALEVFVNTWKDSYFPPKERRVTQTEAAQARFKIKRAKKYQAKSQ